MDRRTFLGAGTAVAASLLLAPQGQAASAKAAADGKEIALPAPDRSGGKPLMACLNARRSEHTPGNRDLTEQQLSNVLWAACGINRDSGKRTVPTALNRQRIGVYVALKDGVWEYLPETHAIRRVLMGDRRKEMDGSACILLFAAPGKDPYAGVHVGSMYQNVGLYCASEGLANCVKHQRHDALTPELPLQEGWEIIMLHCISR